MRCRAYYLACVYGLLHSFDKALILNEHASLFLRRASGYMDLSSQFDHPALELPSCDSQIDEALLASQRDRLAKEWSHYVPAEDEVGLSKLSLEGKGKKGPTVFDISFNYAMAVDGDAVKARGTGLKASEVQKAKVQEMKAEVAKESETASTQGKSRFLSWFGR